MIDTLHIRLSALRDPTDTMTAVDAVEIEAIENPRSYRCPKCMGIVPADMLIRFRGGWECSACIETRHIMGEGTRGELWIEAGQEDVPASGEYWTRPARRARKHRISRGTT